MTSQALPVRFDSIPLTLRTRLRWCTWRNEPRDDGLTAKVPYATSGHRAKPNEPTLWNGFDEVRTVIETGMSRYDGIGFVFGANDGIVGVDLDDCRNPSTGVLSCWAQYIVEWLNSYTEVSPSGTGVKVFLRGQLPGQGRKFNLTKPEKGVKTPAIEIYSDDRYFTMTGHHLTGTPDDLMDRPSEVTALYDDQVALHDLRKVKPEVGALLSKPGGTGDSEDNRSVYNFMLHSGWSVEDVERRFRQTLPYRAKHDELRNGSTFLREDIERAESTMAVAPAQQKERVKDKYPLTHVSSNELKDLVQRLASDYSLILNEETRDMLRTAGEDVWTRQVINQVLSRSGINTQHMWNLLDVVETVSEPITPRAMAALALQEECERLVDALLPSRGFSLLAAKPKVGKSTLVRNLIMRTLHGGTFLGRTINRVGPVVYYCLEESLVRCTTTSTNLG